MTQMNKNRKTRKDKAPCCNDVGDLLAPRFFRALGDPTRVVILAYLTEMCGPATVTEVDCCRPVDVSVVSRHLATLRDAGIVSGA